MNIQKELNQTFTKEEFIKEALVLSSFILDHMHPNFNDLTNLEKEQKINEFLIDYKKILLGLHNVKKEEVTLVIHND